MELREFITQSLMQIAEGVEDAQKHLKEKGSKAIVNTNMTATDVGHVVTGGRRRPVEFVEFDVAILADEGTETKAGGGITVASLLKLEASGKRSQNKGSESRIKFKIPMSYPMHEYSGTTRYKIASESLQMRNNLACYYPVASSAFTGSSLAGFAAAAAAGLASSSGLGGGGT